MTDELGRCRSRLLQELWDVALKWGEGIDGDGRPMAWTLDCRELVLSSSRIHRVGRLLWEKVRPHDPEMVGGLTLSADALVAALLEQAAREGHPLGGLLVRRQPKAHGLRKRIEGPPIRPGSRVVVVDDVISSGRAVVAAADAIRSAGGEVVGAAVLVDFRRPNAIARLERAGIPAGAVFELAELGLSDSAASGRAALTPRWRWRGELSSGARVVRGGPRADPARDAIVVAAESGIVTAVGAAGSPRWRRAVAGPIRTAPAVSGDGVIVGDGHGAVHRLDAGTGLPVWAVATGGRVTAGPDRDGVVAVAAGGGARVLALDPATGATIWEAGLTAAVHAGPLADDERGQLIVGDARGHVTALDRGTGEPRWTLTTGGEVRGAPVVAHGDSIVAAGYDGRAYAIDADSGALRWSRRLSTWLYNAALAVGETVVIGADRTVIAVNAGDGSTAWVARAGGRVIGAPALVAGRWLAVGTESGDLSLLDATTGELSHRVDTGAPIRSTPAVLGDLVTVVSEDGDLHGYGFVGSP